MAPTVLHLRSETKPLERRSALTPTTTKALLDAGYIVNVERSPGRIFDDGEFEAVGATLVPEGSWVDAPKDHIIVGLKELPESDAPLHHQHIQFGHCYKYQENWDRYLSRFVRGGGTLYDIEFLTDESGRRVSAFGYNAGYAGAAVALLAWSHQLVHPTVAMPSLPMYPSATPLIADVEASLASAIPHNNSQHPRVLIMGALGRCGTGAIDFCLAAGIPASNLVKWDLAETAAGGPFPEIAASDIFINCVYLFTPIPPFITLDSLAKPGRKLRVACDISCDPNSTNNPMPIYREYTTFTRPTQPIHVEGDGPPLTVISIDHLPSLVPREASEAFSAGVLPSLKVLDNRHDEGVWVRAEKLFKEKASELPAALVGS
ncbi:mitochondrial Homoaconitase [Trichoglossum hirsutum]|uniref:Saccharopine dehydrogenase [NAD(+), L-lysine-forming] n=1 Tax=Trichoglossum hirsutum TaxID=265104 RepID=A0A9P8RRC4_9PEZI|nr:mitochondrial Homoaconitase [Trichoglossum hirsutum]